MSEPTYAFQDVSFAVAKLEIAEANFQEVVRDRAKAKAEMQKAIAAAHADGITYQQLEEDTGISRERLRKWVQFVGAQDLEDE